MMKFKTILFDFDSTLVTIEGVDELARLNGVFDQVTAMTQAAMRGELTFDQVFYKRLELIKPSDADLQMVGNLYRKSITPGARELISLLKSLNYRVGVISGGYEQAIVPALTDLGLDESELWSIRLGSDSEGKLTIPIHNEILVDQNGKRKIIESLHLPKPVVFVGDGSTDLATKLAVDKFIGFGGISYRESVEKNADAYVYALDEVLYELDESVSLGLEDIEINRIENKSAFISQY